MSIIGCTQENNCKKIAFLKAKILEEAQGKDKNKTAEETSIKNSATSTIIDKDIGSQTTEGIDEKLSKIEKNHFTSSMFSDENSIQQAEVVEVKSQGTQDETNGSEAPIELEDTAEVVEVKSQGTQDEPIESEAPSELEQTAEEE
ncbi:uncharacterized protein LOC143305930 [Osmia lignaria lignaria]|uniref:uncharacterized protein LOC143305930 n=1 Tax=Osmia lignaria lignaria TaxID=1437193 RepID=UPI00402B1F2E